MRSHSDIVRQAGTAEEVAEFRGISVHTVRSWIKRNRIPVDQWKAFVDARQTTFEELAGSLESARAA